MAEEFDLSKGIEQLQEMLSSKDGEEQIQNILGSLMGSANDTSAEDDNAKNSNTTVSSGENSPGDIFSGLGNIDTLMKIQNVMNAVSNQKDSAAANFLQALKPYLSKDRRSKIDQAAKLITVSKVLKAFKNPGGD